MWDKTASNKYAEISQGALDYNEYADHHDKTADKHASILEKLMEVGERGDALSHHAIKVEQHRKLANNYRELAKLNADDPYFDPKRKHQDATPYDFTRKLDSNTIDKWHSGYSPEEQNDDEEFWRNVHFPERD
jgi:hypothetical protein